VDRVPPSPSNSSGQANLLADHYSQRRHIRAHRGEHPQDLHSTHVLGFESKPQQKHPDCTESGQPSLAHQINARPYSGTVPDHRLGGVIDLGLLADR